LFGLLIEPKWFLSAQVMPAPSWSLRIAAFTMAVHRSETMRLYEAVLREFPTYERKDEVLFNLAYNLYEVGRREPAVQRYEELLRDYPSSRFVPDTLIQLGNHAFDVTNSLERREPTSGPGSRRAPRSSPTPSQAGLVRLQRGATGQALDKLKETVEFSGNRK
jgi:tetratricopeptide (TPR) repeat protein